MKIALIIITAAFIVQGCTNSSPQNYTARNKNIVYAGLTEKLENEVILIGSASSATSYFTGDTCVIFLRNYNEEGRYNYYSIELDNEDLGRFKINGDEMKAIPIAITFQKEIHKISVYKSTEAAIGSINFGGIFCEKLVEPEKQPLKNIEFIGNSITCGMGDDTLAVPCNANQWYDQHNAYWAYGPTVSRALKVNFLLSSVSGIGIYRNWNSNGPTMPEVYENLYLNTDESQKRDFSTFTPNVVSICLGTNDFSDGDGLKERLPFDSIHFTSNYIHFIEIVYSHYPETQIALLNSPMLKEDKNPLLDNCLHAVKEHFDSTNYIPIEIFHFNEITPHGCDGHPDIDDQMLMADQLYPFYKRLLEK